MSKAKQLSIAARPKILKQMVGQQRIAKRLNGWFAQDRLPSAFMFTGEKGAGKTTVAGIIAVAFQCEHQKEFGNPCKDCRKKARQGAFSIYEINAAKTDKAQILNVLEMADYPVVDGNKRVYIFDEMHRASDAAKDLLLKYFEDESDKNVWMLCTTRPDKVPATLASRCQQFKLKSADTDDTQLLVDRLLTKYDSELSRDALVLALQEKQITSYRLITQAVDDYLVSRDADEAANIDGGEEKHTKNLCRAVAKGDWSAITRLLNEANNVDVMSMKNAVVGYLKTCLLDSAEVDSKTKRIAKAIQRLSYNSYNTDLQQMAAFAAELCFLAEMFAENSL